MLIHLALAAAAGALTLPPAAELRAQIAARDAELFDVLFLQCAPDKMRAIVADDIEFYHDKDGMMRGADAFVAQYARTCAERAKPDAWRSRRALVEPTLIVNPVPGLGAMEAAEHVFYERKGDGPEKLVGRARFAMVWTLAPDGWRLSRVLSYDHGPAKD